MSFWSNVVRENFKKGDDIRDAGLTSPSDVVRFDNICYGPEEYWQSLDLYRPLEQEGKKLPVIVNIHGGGWVYGDKELYQYYCMSLAEHGFAVINFTYRLAPEFKFPSGLEDVNSVINWAFDHAEKYLLDMDHVFLIGDSAGAHMTGLYSNICTNPSYAEKFSFTVRAGFVPTAVCMNCGAYRINYSDDPKDMNSGLMNDLIEGGASTEKMKILQVADFMTPDFPPTFYMTCTGDFLKEQAPILMRALLDNNIPSEFHFFGDKDHELGHVFHCNMKTADARKCNRIECEFFKRFL